MPPNAGRVFPFTLKVKSFAFPPTSPEYASSATTIKPNAALSRYGVWFSMTMSKSASECGGMCEASTPEAAMTFFIDTPFSLHMVFGSPGHFVEPPTV